jgi:AraC-like DNA-binding protein
MQTRSKTVQKRSTARHVSFEPWKLDAALPFHVVDYTHKRRDRGPFHIHDVLEIGWCHSGDGVFLVEDKAYSFKAGDVYVISSLEAHYAYPPCGTPSDWTFLFVDPVRLLGAAVDPALLDLSQCCGSRFDNRFRPESTPNLCAAVRDLVAEFRARGAHFRDAIHAGVIRILVELKRRARHLSEGVPRRPLAPTLNLRSHERMQSLEPALKLIARDYARPLVLSRLSKACFMSESHFRRVFVSQMGMSPRDYLLGYRISMAACLLRGTKAAVTQIAYDTGFQTLSSFNRQFQKRKGCAPRSWRKQGYVES